MAPEILDGTANCSSPFMSPSVCLSGERRHASVSDVAQVAKTAGCRIHHTISTVECSEINLRRRRHCRFHLTPLGEDVLFFCFYLFFFNKRAEIIKTTATLSRICWISASLILYEGAQQRDCLHSRPCMSTRTHAITHSRWCMADWFPW